MARKKKENIFHICCLFVCCCGFTCFTRSLTRYARARFSSNFFCFSFIVFIYIFSLLYKTLRSRVRDGGEKVAGASMAPPSKLFMPAFVSAACFAYTREPQRRKSFADNILKRYDNCCCCYFSSGTLCRRFYELLF